MQLEQSAANSVGKEQSRSCTATFTRRTTPGSLVVVVVAAAGTLPSTLRGPSGFSHIGSRGLRDIQASIYYRQNAPATSSVTVSSEDADKSLQVRAMEYSGMAQANVLDRVNIESSDSDSPHTGRTGTLSQPDELVLAFIINQYASSSQYGFSGGMAKLYDTTSPREYRGDSDSDWERSRLTVHQGIANKTSSWGLEGRLSSDRRWMGFIVSFRAGTTGPARLTSTQAPPIFEQVGGPCGLTVFGPLRSTDPANTRVISNVGLRARVGPFNYQYRLGGWEGLLIGDDTEYTVESHDGLEGWQIRTSDDELPRGDGSLRGVDLQSARQILFEIKAGGTQRRVEDLMDVLYRSLVPQRDGDWELIWRHPNRPLRMVRVRPVDLSREMTYRETVSQHQKFALLAADPRHYSAGVHAVEVPAATSDVVSEIIPTSVLNEGNGAAYPLIRIEGPRTGPNVTRIELVNRTGDLSFTVESVLPRNSTLVGDMEARATGAARSVVTIDGQSKYGAWVHPRNTFRLGPGENHLYLRTTPVGAPVVARLEYRDTWSG